VHPAVAQLGYNFVPYRDDRIDDWQNSRKGVTYLDSDTNLILYGAIDDLWVDPEAGTLHVVDYKTTSKDLPITALSDAEYHDAYRRQLEVYSFLLSKNGLGIAPTAYWFYATARKNAEEFNMALQFDPTLIEHACTTGWIEPALAAMKAALEASELPPASASCDLCSYVRARVAAEGVS
jgi:RecB family exonuclease